MSSKYEINYKLAGGHARFFDTSIIPLTSDLQEATGITASCCGCFGLRCECLITLKSGKKERTIVITPSFTDDGSLELYYDTGETQNKFQPGTIGAMNGMNNISKRLPETLEEIIRLFAW